MRGWYTIHDHANKKFGMIPFAGSSRTAAVQVTTPEAETTPDTTPTPTPTPAPTPPADEGAIDVEDSSIVKPLPTIVPFFAPVETEPVEDVSTDNTKDPGEGSEWTIIILGIIFGVVAAIAAGIAFAFCYDLYKQKNGTKRERKDRVTVLGQD